MEKINIHTNEDTSLRKIGSIIKEARLSKNISVKDLATNLKISEQQLKAIEEGRDDLLPEKVFVKAMLKKISEKLKIDISELMNEFNNQTEKLKIEEIVEDVQTKIKLKNSFTLVFVFNIFISGLIGFAASSYIFNLFSNFKNESDTKSLIKDIK